MRNLKRKVALLLAVVMMLSLVPMMNVFGAPAVEVSRPRIVTSIHSEAGNGVADDLQGGLSLSFQVPFSVFAPLTAAQWADVQLVIGLNQTWNHDRDLGAAAAAPLPIHTPTVTIEGHMGGATTIGGVTARAVTVANGRQAVVNFKDITNTIDTTDSAFRAGSDEADRMTITISDLQAQNAGARITVDAIIPGRPGTIRLLDPTQILQVVDVRAPEDSTRFNVTAVSPTNLSGIAAGGAVGSVRFTERHPRTGTITQPVVFTLEAPPNYIWTNYGNATVTFPQGSGFAWTGTPPTLTRSLSSDNRTLIVTVPGGNIGRNTVLGSLPGMIQVDGLSVAPMSGHQVRSEALAVRAVIHVGGTDQTRESWWAGVEGVRVTLGHQHLWGVDITRVGDATNVRSGVTGGDRFSSVIRIDEAGAGTMLNANITVEILTPGVTIRGGTTNNANALIRYNGNPSSDGMPEGWETWRARVDPATSVINNGQTAIFPVVTPTLSTRARSAEIRLNFDVAPGLGDTPVEARVTVMAHPTTVTQTLTIANIFDPVTVEVNAEPAALTFDRPDFGFLLANRLAPITITENVAGTFAQGSFIDVYIRRVVNGVPFGAATLGWNPTWEVTAEVEGEGLRLVRVPGQPVTPNNAVPGAFAMARFEVNRASTEPASVTFNSILSGTIFNEPGVEFEVIIKGSAVQAQQGAVANGPNPMFSAYGGVVAYISNVGNVAPGPGTTAPAPTPTPAPPAAPERVVVATFTPASTASNGVRMFEQINGVTMVNLRGLVEQFDNSYVAFYPGVGNVWQAYNANGDLVVIARADGEWTIMVDSTPMPRIMLGAAENLEGGWFVSASAFGSLFGLLPQMNGANLTLIG